MDRRALVLCAVLTVALGAPASGAELGDTAPECALDAVGDAPRYELARFRGSVVWVDFWASWCAPCAESIPFLNALERELGERGLRVLGINLDEEPAAAEAFLEQHPAHFAQAADPSGECPRRFGVDAMPSAYLLDRRGVIRHVHRGFRAGEGAALRRLVEELLDESEAPEPDAPAPGSPRDASR